MIKKYHLIQALLCASILCFTTACGSKPIEEEPDNREAIIEEAEILPDTEITIPATLVGEELADIPVESTDEDNNVTYHVDGETQSQLVSGLSSEIQTSIDTILADKEYYPNVSDITVNSDCTEFTIYLTTNQPNLYESTLMMSFYTVGDRYQIYNGIPAEDAKTTVIYINAESGEELARTDSTMVQ